MNSELDFQLRRRLTRVPPRDEIKFYIEVAETACQRLFESTKRVA